MPFDRAGRWTGSFVRSPNNLCTGRPSGRIVSEVQVVSNSRSRCGMSRFRYYSGRVLFFVVLILAASAALAATIKPTGTSVPGEVLIKFSKGASQGEVEGIEHLADADQAERITTLTTGHIVRLHSRSKNVDALITALSKNPNVEYVEPNYLLHLVAT